MSEPSHLYEYATVRYLPAVEREEFINVGLIMMCKKQRWIKIHIYLPESKIACFHSDLSVDLLANQLQAFENIVTGKPSAGPIASLSVEERFRWLTAVKSSCIQTSRPHPGISADLDKTFSILFEELVL